MPPSSPWTGAGPLTKRSVDSVRSPRSLRLGRGAVRIRPPGSPAASSKRALRLSPRPPAMSFQLCMTLAAIMAGSPPIPHLRPPLRPPSLRRPLIVRSRRSGTEDSMPPKGPSPGIINADAGRPSTSSALLGYPRCRKNRGHSGGFHAAPHTERWRGTPPVRILTVGQRMERRQRLRRVEARIELFAPGDHWR